MKTIIKLSIQLSILVLSSCSSTSFINRKYTSGVFLQHNKTLTHNTIGVDTTKQYASLNQTIELKKPVISLTPSNDKEIINSISNSIIKKDSFFIFQKKGRDVRLKKRAEGENILIVINPNKKVSKINKIDSKPSGYNEISNKQKSSPYTFFSRSENKIIGVFLFIVAFISLLILTLAGAFTLR
jgi:hypothetical protein